MSDSDEIEYEIEYRGRVVRRALDGQRWLIVPARGVTNARLAHEDSQLEFSTLEAVQEYVDSACDER